MAGMVAVATSATHPRRAVGTALVVAGGKGQMNTARTEARPPGAFSALSARGEIENGGLIELSEIENAIKIWKFYFHKYTELFNGNDELEKLKSSILNFVEKHIKPTHPYVSEARIWQNYSSRLGKEGRPLRYDHGAAAVS